MKFVTIHYGQTDWTSYSEKTLILDKLVLWKCIEETNKIKKIRYQAGHNNDYAAIS